MASTFVESTPWPFGDATFPPFCCGGTCGGAARVADGVLSLAADSARSAHCLPCRLGAARNHRGIHGPVPVLPITSAYPLPATDADQEAAGALLLAGLVVLAACALVLRRSWRAGLLNCFLRGRRSRRARKRRPHLARLADPGFGLPANPFSGRGGGGGLTVIANAPIPLGRGAREGFMTGPSGREACCRGPAARRSCQRWLFCAALQGWLRANRGYASGRRHPTQALRQRPRRKAPRHPARQRPTPLPA